jgi:hypothetical protein
MPLVAIVVFAACSHGDNPFACSDPPKISDYAINIAPRDSVTNAWLARGTTAIVRDGSYYDSVTVPMASFDELIIGLAANRIGTYAVTVRKSGYNDWTKNGVQVGADACGIGALLLTAKLQPVPKS